MPLRGDWCKSRGIAVARLREYFVRTHRPILRLSRAAHDDAAYTRIGPLRGCAGADTKVDTAGLESLEKVGRDAEI